MKWLIRIAVYGALAFALCFVAVRNLTGCTCASREQVAELFITQDINIPLLSYKMATGHYPTTEQGLMALIKAPTGVTNWKGPYLKCSSFPLDPWKNPYHYRYPGIHNPNTYDLWSSGPDGIDGTADDIGNWQLPPFPPPQLPHL
jgi:general secretion pathway protein G